MKTVTEVSRMSGVSVRTLHHYDAIGLLKPTQVTEAGYRLYDEEAVKTLCLILLYKEFGFTLKKIGGIIHAPDFDRNKALEEQIQKMEEKRKTLQNRITLAQGIKLTGVKYMNIDHFDAKKIDDYSAQVETLWGQSREYQEFSQKTEGYTKADFAILGDAMMAKFIEIGTLREQDPSSETVQNWVAGLHAFINEHFYACEKPVLACLGNIYAGGGDMTENIDAAGGPGTGTFVKAAIDIYCAK